MPKEEPLKDDKPIPQPPPPPEASGQELTEEELKAVSGGMMRRGGLSEIPDVCISQLS